MPGVGPGCLGEGSAWLGLWIGRCVSFGFWAVMRGRSGSALFPLM